MLRRLSSGNIKRAILGAPLLALTLGMCACSMQDNDTARDLFNNPQESSDQVTIPKDLVDESSTRLLGSDSYGYSYYIAKPVSPETSGDVCLVALPQNQDGQYWIGCSNGLPITLQFDGLIASLSDSNLANIGAQESGAIGSYLTVNRTI